MPDDAPMEGFFRCLFDQVADAIYILDPETSAIIGANEAGCRDLGMSREEVLEETVVSLQKDVIGIAQWREIADAIRATDVYVFVGRHRRKDGSEFPVEVHTNAIVHAGREYFVSVTRDLSRRQASAQELEGRDHIRNFALHESSDGLWDWNVITGEVYFSPQWERMLGFGPNEVEPAVDTWVNLVHPEDIDGVMRDLGAHLDGQTVRYQREYRLKNRNDDFLWVHDRGKVVERDDHGWPLRVVGMVHDITDRKQLEQRLRDIAHRDELTGLPNRRAGYDFFERHHSLAQRKGHPLSICLFDVDYFKRINDNHGHLAGDRVLVELADLLTEGLRKSDVVCRWGGEEFLLLLPHTDREAAVKLADRLRRKVEATVGRALGIGVTMSGGVGAFPADASSIEDLVSKADDALYRAKASGRNRVLASDEP